MWANVIVVEMSTSLNRSGICFMSYPDKGRFTGKLFCIFRLGNSKISCPSVSYLPTFSITIDNEEFKWCCDAMMYIGPSDWKKNVGVWRHHYWKRNFDPRLLVMEKELQKLTHSFYILQNIQTVLLEVRENYNSSYSLLKFESEEKCEWKKRLLKVKFIIIKL